MLLYRSRSRGRLLALVALTVGLSVSAEKLLALDDTNPAPKVDQDKASTSNSGEGIQRWLDLNTLSFSFRYRNQTDSDDYRFFDNWQQRSLIDGRLKLDADGKYAVHFHVSSGRTFNWAYSDEIGNDFQYRTSGATAAVPAAILPLLYSAVLADPSDYQMAKLAPSRGWEMSFRQLYFSATPVKELSFEYGSIGIERGASTEATTYDDDGYLTGERLRILAPDHLFFDQIAITFAYEGDLFQTSFFNRAERLGQSNYHQFLASKRFGNRLSTSIDYTFDKGTHTLRQALLLKVPELKAIDSVRPEFYQRLNDKVLSGQTYDSGSGFAITASKTFAKRFQLEGGYAGIDEQYGVLTGIRIMALFGFSMNGDAFLTGNRVFTRANWKVTPYITFFGYFTHQVTTPPLIDTNLNKQSLNGGATINFQTILTKMHVL